MKKIFLMTLCLSSNLYAETSIFQTIPIPSKYTNFSGNIPYINGIGFEEINQIMSDTLLADYDSRISFSTERVYQDNQYLSIHIHLEIEGGRSYYRERYYVIDLKNKELVLLNQMLKKYQLSPQTISKKIAKNVEPCIQKNKLNNDLCSGADMEYFYRYYTENPNFINLKNADGFYLKKNTLGISFDAGPFSVPFEFNLKTKKIQ